MYDAQAQYDAGYKAQRNGEPCDPKKPSDWQDGWCEAQDDEDAWEFDQECPEEL